MSDQLGRMLGQYLLGQRAVKLAGEAEKSADVDIVEVRAVGRFGRLFVCGDEENVKMAIQAATAAIEAIDGRSE